MSERNIRENTPVINHRHELFVSSLIYFVLGIYMLSYTVQYSVSAVSIVLK